ncbi:FHA domain-containing protein [Hyalangium rubrum]|uniref:FHA domain-containing protein n=1 Tax=Hyalangium rubrum TaxID=3103134 RepID=A0ABU5HHN1_9BACT|nr:FHA domain-containing protein [Hyalangium sp. s54d21]MDY7232973.1 FHA domain-containing protein [Hyalangium sp. s54d21]
MAILEHRGTRTRSVLLSRHLVGRSSLAHLRLNEPNVSGEHAVLSWDGRRWELHDLGSRNGTTLDGKRLGAGERVAVKRGAVLGFAGAGNLWELVDDSPPVALARPLDGGEPVCAEHELIALPDAEAPEVTVYRDAVGDWVVERDGDTERTADGREVSAGGRSFTLHLPDIVASTWDAESLAPSLERLGLRFSVSRDEEFIAVTVLAEGGRTIDLGARAHHALLLALARARLEDQREAAQAPKGSGHPETRHGWLFLEDLAESLKLDEMHLNVAVYRCRQQLAGAGVTGAARLIERRKPTRQLRLGVSRLEIVSV